MLALNSYYENGETVIFEYPCPCQQFHQYQQNEQSLLTLTHWTQKRGTTTYDEGNPAPVFGCGGIKLVNEIQILPSLLQIFYNFLQYNFNHPLVERLWLWSYGILILWIHYYSLNTVVFVGIIIKPRNSVQHERHLNITRDDISKYKKRTKYKVNGYLIIHQSMKIDTNENKWTHSICAFSAYHYLSCGFDSHR